MEGQEEKLLPLPEQIDCGVDLVFKGWSRWDLLPVASGD